jgi:hypothetical protein
VAGSYALVEKGNTFVPAVGSGRCIGIDFQRAIVASDMLS